MAGSLAHKCRDAGPIPAILNDHTHKALGLCLAQRPGAFFLALGLLVTN